MSVKERTVLLEQISELKAEKKALASQIKDMLGLINTRIYLFQFVFVLHIYIMYSTCCIIHIHCTVYITFMMYEILFFSGYLI